MARDRPLPFFNPNFTCRRADMHAKKKIAPDRLPMRTRACTPGPALAKFAVSLVFDCIVADLDVVELIVHIQSCFMMRVIWADEVALWRRNAYLRYGVDSQSSP